MFNTRFWIYFAVIVFCIFYGTFEYSKLSSSYRLLLLLLVLTVLAEVYGRILSLKIDTGAPYFHFHVILEYSIISAVFYTADIYRTKWGKHFSVGSVLFLTVFALLNAMYLQSVEDMPTNTIMISSVLIVFMSLIVLVRLINGPLPRRLLLLPEVWLCFGSIVYYSITMIIFGAYNYLVRIHGFPLLIKNVVYLANIGVYISYGVAIYMNVQKNSEVFESTPEQEANA